MQALTPADLMAAQALVRRLPIGESVVDAILKLVRAGRPETSDLDVVRQRVAWGPGPRASQAFMLACRARAIIQGRLAPSVDDVVALAGPDPAPSHGGELLGPRRGHHGRDGDRPDVRPVGVGVSVILSAAKDLMPVASGDEVLRCAQGL